MNSDIIIGRLKQWKGQFREVWADWFGDECGSLGASNDLLAGILQEDYGREREKGIL